MSKEIDDCESFDEHEKTCFYISLKNNGSGCEGKECKHYKKRSK